MALRSETFLKISEKLQHGSYYRFYILFQCDTSTTFAMPELLTFSSNPLPLLAHGVGDGVAAFPVNTGGGRDFFTQGRATGVIDPERVLPSFRVGRAALYSTARTRRLAPVRGSNFVRKDTHAGVKYSQCREPRYENGSAVSVEALYGSTIPNAGTCATITAPSLPSSFWGFGATSRVFPSVGEIGEQHLEAWRVTRVDLRGQGIQYAGGRKATTAPARYASIHYGVTRA